MYYAILIRYYAILYISSHELVVITNTYLCTSKAISTIGYINQCDCGSLILSLSLILSSDLNINSKQSHMSILSQ